jgi:glycosyltransferase involved in cell wall biosynthesis
MKKYNSTPLIVGHPFAPIGRGEDARAAFRSFHTAMFTLPIRDIVPLSDMDMDIKLELDGHLVSYLSDTVNIFFINGDEIAPILARLKNEMSSRSYNIIYPAWELSIYPSEWASQLELFGEVWAQSRFVYESLKRAVSKPVHYLPLAAEVNISSFLDRRYFGIPESSYVFLFFFDFTSYIARKNPLDVLKAFEKVCRKRPGEDVRLVIKTGGATQRREDYIRIKEAFDRFPYKDRLIFISKTLSNNEIKNLVRCCDCFISLHRSEGFGRGMAEAMFLGKPVIATGYSGNLDFMNDENSCLVSYDLVPLTEGQYPHWCGQVWAQPDIDQAVGYMLKLLSDRNYGRGIGTAASRYLRTFFSYRAIGLQYKKRIDEILKMRAFNDKDLITRVQGYEDTPEKQERFRRARTFQAEVGAYSRTGRPLL